MRRTFVHCAELLLEPGADPASPGGAVTLALCGSWDHLGPCRWPHETAAVWDAQLGKVRVVFVADAEDEVCVRASIEAALTAGECIGQDGKPSRWQMRQHGAGGVTEKEESWGAPVGRS